MIDWYDGRDRYDEIMPMQKPLVSSLSECKVDCSGVARDASTAVSISIDRSHKDPYLQFRNME